MYTQGNKDKRRKIAFSCNIMGAASQQQQSLQLRHCNPSALHNKQKILSPTNLLKLQTLNLKVYLHTEPKLVNKAVNINSETHVF